MRMAGIDYGMKRIGVALSDERGVLASPLGVIEHGRSLETAAAAVAKSLEKHLPLKGIVIGLPLHLKGTESHLSEQVRLFAKQLQQLLAVPLYFWDERLTSAQVDRTLREVGFNRKQRAARSDAMAAAAILQNYLDSLESR